MLKFFKVIRDYIHGEDLKEDVARAEATVAKAEVALQATSAAVKQDIGRLYAKVARQTEYETYDIPPEHMGEIVGLYDAYVQVRLSGNAGATPRSGNVAKWALWGAIAKALPNVPVHEKGWELNQVSPLYWQVQREKPAEFA